MPKASYFYKGNEYKILTRCEMKHPETGDWIMSLVYWDVRSKKVYCRSFEDFDQKFLIGGVKE